MSGWTRLRWSHRDLNVDGDSYTVTLMAPWYVPLWLVHLLKRRQHVRDIRDCRIARAVAVSTKSLGAYARLAPKVRR